MGSTISFLPVERWKIINTGTFVKGKFTGLKAVRIQIGQMEYCDENKNIEIFIPVVVFRKLIDREYLFRRTNHDEWIITDSTGKTLYNSEDFM